MGLSAILVALALGLNTACASLIDVNFYSAGVGGSTASGAAVVGTATDTWNGFDGDNGGGFATLVNSQGAATPVSLFYTNYGGSAVRSATANIQPNASLMSDYIFNNGTGNDDIVVTLSGLLHSTPYDLYVYLASNDASGGDRSASVTANSASSTATGNPQITFINGQNYLLLVPTSTSAGIITITETPNAGVQEVDMNGLQLSTLPTTGVPDASPTLRLLLVGGIGLILFARRTSRSGVATAVA